MSTIAQLLETSRYNIETIEKLESHLNDQIERKTNYDLDANLALLKLYQFFPEKLQKTSVSKVLAKALMNLPSNDFILAMYLVPEQLHKEDSIASLISLSNLLETAQFAKFWSDVKDKKTREFLNTIPGFDDSARRFILATICTTFQSVSVESIQELMGLSNVDALVKEYGFRVEGNQVKLEQHSDSRSKQKKISDSLKFEDLSKMLKAIR